MKSIFTKLSTLLLCGAVAMVSCTDFSEDIQAVDNKVDNLGSQTATELANLESAITALESKLAAQYATKDEVAALKTTLEQSIASEVEGLSKDIAAVSAALKTAKDDINTAIAGLDNKKADKADVEAAVKTATDAIAALQGQLESAKAEIEAEIEAVEAEIAATQEELAAQINGVDAKANELHNTLLSLSEYLATLEAKINEVNNTLLSLSLFLEEYEASVDAKFQEILNTFSSLSLHLNEREALVDAQLSELQSTLISLSYHLEEYEAVTDFKLVELQGSLAALSTYLEEYEASVDAKFEEILNTFTSLDLFLDEQFAAVAANDEALFAHVETLQEAFTALNNLLADEAAVREENDEALYAHIETLQEAFTALNNIVADLEAEDEAIYAEVENVRTYVAQVYNALGLEIEAVDAALAAHVAAFEAYKEVLEAKLAGLEAEDGAIYTLIGTTTTALNNLIADLQAEDEAIYAEIENVRTYIAQIYNAVSDEVAALEAQLVESVEGLESMIRDTQASLTNALNLIADVEEKVEANAAAIASLEAAVEMLTEWAVNHEGLYGELTKMIANLAAELDEQVSALQAEDGAIYDLLGETTTALNNLIADATERIDNIEVYITENFNTVGAAIRSLENILNDLSADLNDAIAANSAAIEALVARVQSLVYVPDYSDHKATINWAKVAGSYSVMPAAAEDGQNANYSIVTKATDIKYLVKANAGEDAETVAATIAANPSVLDYIVTDVKTRGASESGADLEIVNVKAEGEYIIVSVVAKNFDAKFFENKRQGIYSAALALVDTKGNNLTSEYTNLVPGEAAHIQLGLYLAEGDDVNNVTDSQYTDYMPCNDSETVYTSVCPTIGFIIDDEKAMANLTSIQPYLTIEDLNTLGYDMSVKYRLDLDKAISSPLPSGMVSSGNIFNKYFKVGNDRNGDVHVSVVENTPFEAVGQSIYAKYTATVNNTTVTYTHYFELDNAQIVVNVGNYDEVTGEYYVEVPWTVKLRDELTVDGKQYAADLTVSSTWTGYDDIKMLMDNYTGLLSDRKFTYFVKDAGKWVESTDVKFGNKRWPIETDPTYKWCLKGGTYAWNNEYKIVYTAVNETEHIDITVNFIIKLTHKPVDPFTVNIPVTFEIAPSGAFQAPVDVLAEMYKKVAGVEEGSYDYLGFGEKNADVWAAYTANVAAVYMAGGSYAQPVVNDNKLAAGYASNIWNLTTAQIAQNQYVDGNNVITWDANGIIDFDFDVTIEGSANIPAYDLIYATDYATEANPRVHVNGKKDGQGHYVIDQADLAKYFNVTRLNLAGGKKGIAEGHTLTVDFTVTDAAIAAKLNAAEFATVVEDNKGTYLTLKSETAVLQWNEFTGLEIPVTASLKVNGFELETLDLVLWTEDPLTLKNVAPVSVKRAPGKTPTVATIYKNLSLTGILEPQNNLIDATVAVVDNWSETYTQATELYGANMTISFAMAEEGVYYEENGNKIYLDKNKFALDADKGTITLYGDDADLNVTYIAKCYVQLTHRFCEDAHAKAQLVTVKFVPNK